MTTLANLLFNDPTLEAADIALMAHAAQEKPRGYLGMSSVGESCQRKTWYRFRFIAKEVFDSATLKRFADGHASEKVQADRLRLVPEITLETHLPDGNQFRYTDHDGHFSGHCDGKITGLLQAPKKLHIWEHKSVGEKKFNEFKKIKAEIGEKETLRKWNYQYWIQAILYMFYEGTDRHYITVSTPGCRDTTSARTESDIATAIRYKDLAKRIINSNEPPEKIGNSSYFECKWCTFKEVCHNDAMPDRTCRSCCHSTPIENGTWHCSRWGKTLTLDEQLAGCSAHIFLPKLVNGEIVSNTETSITYKFKDGTVWVDSEQGNEHR